LDDVIKVIGICYGQALALATPLTNLFKMAGTDTAVYLTPKMMLAADQINWGIKNMNRVMKDVEDPDPMLLQASIETGEAIGKSIFKDFQSCLTECSDKKGNDLNICTDACIEGKASKSHAIYKRCEDIYKKPAVRKQ